MTVWAPPESTLLQIMEGRTWTHPDCLLPLRWDTGWEQVWRYVSSTESRDRIMRRERDQGRIPQADGWIYCGAKTLDYPDGLKLLTETRTRWEWT